MLKGACLFITSSCDILLSLTYLQLYSDPEYFVSEWIMEMEKQRQVAKAKRIERKKKRAESTEKRVVVATNKVEVTNY